MTCHPAGMETTNSDIITAHSGNKVVATATGEHVRIRRGHFLHLGGSGQAMTPWEAKRRVAEARILVIARECSQRLVFTLYSALLLWGVDGWLDNPDVSFRTQRRYPGSKFPDVQVAKCRVGGVRVRETRMVRWVSGWLRTGDIEFESLEDTALLFACTRHPLEAFVAVCGILRALTGLDKWVLRRDPSAAESVRQELLAMLDGRPGTRGIRTARRVLTFASAQCESVGERAFLWVLLTVCPEMPRLQHEVVIGGVTRFIDFAFPSLGIAVEFDGMGKLGSFESEVVRNRREMFERDQALTRAGWKIYHFGWTDLSDMAALRTVIVRTLGWSGANVDPERRNLWRTVPPEVASRSGRS